MEQKQRNITCLIIDDEEEACDRLETLLGKIPNVEVVGKSIDAERAIAAAVRLLPEIIFLDIEMPKHNGLEVVKSIRSNNVFPTFIFVTGHDQYAIKAIRSEAFDYLLKPVDIDDLKESVGRYTASKNEKLKTILPAKLKSHYSLTDREIEIIQLLLEGKTSKEIGDILFISSHTADTHRRNILEKTGTKSTAELHSFLNDLQ
ncbi:MAG: response regulator transcription factor [Ignavibacteriales bacterium]|nr:response regulator transcription factor [Ignavibacteriales bacterium]